MSNKLNYKDWIILFGGLLFSIVLGTAIWRVIIPKDVKVENQYSNSITRTETTLINDPNNSIENTKKFLIDYDWMYPSENNPISAWKFLRDGTFNYSTTMFGGMSAWGNW